MANGMLTKKEVEVIRAASSGTPTAELAELMSITQGTLKWHLHNIYQKLGVRNRTQALRQAEKIGYL